jgi:glucose-6-phosphate isomerase
LEGAHGMDQHFQSAPLEHNMPVLLALVGIWYINFYGGGSHVIAPYDQYLHRLPAFIQQLDMESNGKQTTLDGQPVDYETAPIIWGETGINGQHAFFQLLHQGTHITPIDLIASLENTSSLPGHHEILLANLFAQAEAFMRGKTADEVRAELAARGLEGDELEAKVPHRVFGGNRPSNTLLMTRLDPKHLGALIALYEHKIFVQGVVWHINSFDQWGVELGKQLAKTIHAELAGKQAAAEHDSSTMRLIALYQRVNGGADAAADSMAAGKSEKTSAAVAKT